MSSHQKKFTPYQSIDLGFISRLADEVHRLIGSHLGHTMVAEKRTVLECIILHLFEADIVGIYTNSNAFGGLGNTPKQRQRMKQQYLPKWFTHDRLERVLKALQKSGCIEREEGRLAGWDDPETATPIPSQIKAIGWLKTALRTLQKALANPDSSAHLKQPQGHRKEPVVVKREMKDKKGKRKGEAAYRDTGKIKKARRDLKAINKFLSHFVITYQTQEPTGLPERTPDPQGIPIDLKRYRGIDYEVRSLSKPIVAPEVIPQSSLSIMQKETPRDLANIGYSASKNKTGTRRRISCAYHMSIPHRVLRKGVNRIYSPSFQGLSKEHRKTVQIGGEDTVELDYNATHPMLLYAEAGIQYQRDPYSAVCEAVGDMKGEYRPLVKSLFTRLLNNNSTAKARYSWERGMARAILKGGHSGNRYLSTEEQEKRLSVAFEAQSMLMQVERLGGLDVLLKAITDTHASITGRLCQGKDTGVELMHLDARIALLVVETMHRHGVPCLSIHDSFRVPASKERLLRDAMAGAWSEVTGGFSCPVSYN